MVDELLDRWDDLRWKVVDELRDQASLGLIIYALILGVALAIGLFAAIIATDGPSDSALAAGSRYALRPVTGDVVTRTITRDGKTRRVIRHRTRAGDVVYETIPGRGTTLAGRTVALPGQTLRETHTQVATQTIASTVTQTATEVVTVTEIEPVTVTVVETVTESPGPP